jgi:hypothetical protein
VRAVRARAVFASLSLLFSSERAFAADPPPDASDEPTATKAATDGASPATQGAPSATQPPPVPQREPPPEIDPRGLAAATAVVPGIIVHGTGHYVAGQTTTGNRLLLAEGVGFGLVLGAGSVIVATGASRYFTGPAAATVILGVGLFATSFFADVYGTLSPDPGAAARRASPPPWIETELGYRHVGDPLFDYEHFLFQRISAQSGPLRLTPSAWISTDWDNARYRIEGAYRILGATPTADARPVTNDHLEAVAGLVQHRYVTEHFTRGSMELAVDARYDLGHIGPTLNGAFVEGGVGYAFGRIDYDIPGVEVPADFDDLLLARLGFGAVFRGASHPGSEARLYYDHRHDDYAAGLVSGGLGSGVPGHFGIEARWFFSDHVGASGMAEIGSAVVAGVSLLFRQTGAGLGRSKRSEP